MILPKTEMLHDDARGLDSGPLSNAARVLADAQAEAAQSVAAASEAICDGARAMARAIGAGGRLVYAAAGSSGLMAVADALELGGTFSINPQQVRILMAGGIPTGSEMPGNVEDDTSGLSGDLADLTAADCVIALSASGTTPYALAAGEAARSMGATLIGIANNPGTPLLEMADHPILLATPPEVIAGSTRMGAGTAQKIALNMLSTLMAVELGHVYDGMMVNLVADNTKLRGRAARMVATIADCPPERAEAALETAGGRVKPAVLIAVSGVTLEAAEEILAEVQGNLRAALARI
ncbi:N-acetylmuramic acid 6-phosphate etherase [Tropicimonas isoalkanivorans]|uniref:N-acetylmuramic acid 6-phosphate etherase n=1 Tax=Tropicimonas isoalkanivorans TaxID=441112 RepID=A0A1I1DCP2_9RHOB|nr:N-acetylmuramic acid 6-phosphate etherase [Tropicimonas isoalkanivorans]SFB72681.1 N-acetylmuramic acid 6-phosphate etherase [Tropicimonas isoalkanivorans]